MHVTHTPATLGGSKQFFENSEIRGFLELAQLHELRFRSDQSHSIFRKQAEHAQNFRLSGSKILCGVSLEKALRMRNGGSSKAVLFALQSKI